MSLSNSPVEPLLQGLAELAIAASDESGQMNAEVQKGQQLKQLQEQLAKFEHERVAAGAQPQPRQRRHGTNFGRVPKSAQVRVQVPAARVRELYEQAQAQEYEAQNAYISARNALEKRKRMDAWQAETEKERQSAQHNLTCAENALARAETTDQLALAEQAMIIAQARMPVLFHPDQKKVDGMPTLQDLEAQCKEASTSFQAAHKRLQDIKVYAAQLQFIGPMLPGFCP